MIFIYYRFELSKLWRELKKSNLLPNEITHSVHYQHSVAVLL